MRIKPYLIPVLIIGMASVICGIVGLFTKSADYIAGFTILMVTGSGLITLSITFTRAVSYKHGSHEVVLDSVSTEKLANTVVEKITPTIRSIKEDGTDYIDHRKAFNDAFDIIKDIVKNEKNAEVELRMIGVALCYTIKFFEQDLLPFILKNQSVKFILRISVMDPEYLSQFSLDEKNFNWSKFSSDLPSRLLAIEQKVAQSGHNNLQLDHFIFRGFPQRHGLMINTQKLFLGVVDWDWNTRSQKPRLTVGSNYYRYYDLSTPAGKSHIDQFRHWFTFYQKYFDVKNRPNATPTGTANTSQSP